MDGWMDENNLIDSFNVVSSTPTKKQSGRKKE
jgi:hypothetical protein